MLSAATAAPRLPLRSPQAPLVSRFPAKRVFGGTRTTFTTRANPCALRLLAQRSAAGRAVGASPASQQAAGGDAEEALWLLPRALARALVTTSVIFSLIASALLSTASSASGWTTARGAAPLSSTEPSASAEAPQYAAASIAPTIAPALLASVDDPSVADAPTGDAALDAAVAAALRAASTCWVQLHTPEQFDTFVLAANRAGFLVLVLFHAHWCGASKRTALELERLRDIHAGRRIVFAHVDCPPPPTVTVDGQQRLLCVPGVAIGSELTRLHRINKTPTTRIFYNGECVDQVIGCRPIELRQATSDMLFKYGL